MKILVLNSGSSSLKYKLFDMPAEGLLAGGQVENIGLVSSRARLIHQPAGGESFDQQVDCPNHGRATELVLEVVKGALSGQSPDAVGHRVVHGKDRFTQSALVTDEVLTEIEAFVPLAPLHQPISIACLEKARRVLPGAPQVAHFDTGFHQSMPAWSYRYAIPPEWHDVHGVRRYGFHGPSHHYVTLAAAEMLGLPWGEVRLITAHLGNGASVTAFDRGRVLDTSMGFTPLEGLMMGTRSGSVDPAIIPYIMERTGRSADEVVGALNNDGGLRAVSGLGRDMRSILEARRRGDERAGLAFDMFVHRLRKCIGAYFFALGFAQAIVFTGGIGERSPEVRAAALEGLDQIGIVIDGPANSLGGGGGGDEPAVISGETSRVKVLVIPTNEELLIARETYRCLKQGDL